MRTKIRSGDRSVDATGSVWVRVIAHWRIQYARSSALQPGSAVRPIYILTDEGEQRRAILSVVGRISREQSFFVRRCASCQGRRFSWSWTQATTHGIFSQEGTSK